MYQKLLSKKDIEQIILDLKTRNWKSLKQEWKFFLQRWQRGWDDSELWNFDETVANFLLPRLKIVRENHLYQPFYMAQEKWDEIVEEMIFGFEFYAGPKKFAAPDRNQLSRREVFKTQEERAEVGILLFARYLPVMWD